jgi:hypothetical protein
MKFNDVLSEAQINELGLLKNIKGAVQGAVSGYKAKKLQSAGSAHSMRIVNNLRAEFQQLVGGGTEPTYQNLIDFLEDQGLGDLDTIPNPSGQQQQPSQSQRIEPTMEAVAGELSAVQIDNIIKDAVKKNYSRIVAAQKGRTVRPSAEKQPETNPQPDPEQSAPPANAGNPVTAPQLKSPPVAGNIESIKKAYAMLDAAERAELKNQLEIIDDQDRLASGTNESKTLQVYSKFLGIDL